MLESEFKTKFRKKLKKMGALAVLQYKQDATTVAGFPDTIAIFEGITVFIEFKKSKTASFRPGQKEWNQKLNDASHFAYICYPENEEEVLKAIQDLL